MKTIDFSKIPVEYRFGEPPTEVDVRKIVGNSINQNTADIGLAELARKIYFSAEPIAIPQEYVDSVIQIVTHAEMMIAPAKIALLNLIRESAKEAPAKTTNRKKTKS